jgi:uncharacterized protein YdaU (DUF1376 family)
MSKDCRTPAFQFYPKDFLGSMSVSLMSADQVGAYILLLCYCWTNGRIPNNRVAIATLCKLPLQTLNSWGESNDDNIVLARFSEDETGKYLVNDRLEKEREKQLERRNHAVSAGKIGAEKRWSKGDSKPYSNPNGLAIATPIAKHSSSSSSSTSYNKEKVEKESYAFESEKFGDKFKSAWASWVEYRRTLKKPKSWKLFFERQHKKLHEYSEENAIKVLQNSTINGYTGLIFDRYPTGDQPTKPANGHQVINQAKPKSVWSINEQIEAVEEEIRQIKEWDRKYDHQASIYYFEDKTKESRYNKLRERVNQLKKEKQSA